MQPSAATSASKAEKWRRWAGMLVRVGRGRHFLSWIPDGSARAMRCVSVQRIRCAGFAPGGRPFRSAAPRNSPLPRMMQRGGRLDESDQAHACVSNVLAYHESQDRRTPLPAAHQPQRRPIAPRRLRGPLSYVGQSLAAVFPKNPLPQSVRYTADRSTDRSLYGSLRQSGRCPRLPPTARWFIATPCVPGPHPPPPAPVHRHRHRS